MFNSSLRRMLSFLVEASLQTSVPHHAAASRDPNCKEPKIDCERRSRLGQEGPHRVWLFFEQLRGPGKAMISVSESQRLQNPRTFGAISAPFPGTVAAQDFEV